MQPATYAARLRYLQATDMDDSPVDFDGLDVRGHDNEKLGSTDGFIVDADSGRVFFVVVDSGGWFTSRRFLLPVGHATIDREEQAMRIDVAKDRLRRYPEFEPDRFHAFSDDDFRAFERRMAEACCPDEAIDVSVASWHFDTRRHYAAPPWWGPAGVPRDRVRPVGAASPQADTRSHERADRDLVTARERQDDRRGDMSPHLDGRAQPGDVLGLETGGERTSIGETADDENERRRTAEREARRQDEEESGPRRSER